MTENHKPLTRAKGIGAKGAQKIVIELKEKMTSWKRQGGSAAIGDAKAQGGTALRAKFRPKPGGVGLPPARRGDPGHGLGRGLARSLGLVGATYLIPILRIWGEFQGTLTRGRPHDHQPL